MIATRYSTTITAAVLAATLLPTGPAAASITLPGGDTTLDGAFAELRYGPASSGLAFLTPRLFVSQFGDTRSPPAQVLGTDLAFDYAVQGLGTPTFTVAYTLRNDSAADTFTDLRFIVNVEPSGSASFLDNVSQNWGAKGAFDPDAREIAAYASPPDPVNNLLNRAEFNNGIADGANACSGGSCDADLALQWNRASLAPGQTWTIGVALSDSAALPASQRYLRAVSVDDPSTLLTVSAVPEPSTWLLLALGLGAVGSAGRLGSRRHP